MKDLTVIIPVYHEEKNILRLLNTIMKKLPGIGSLLVVCDYDEDPTINVLEKNREKYKGNVKIVINMYGKGPANAIKTGFYHVNTDYCVVVMGDCSDTIESINNMYLKMKEDMDIVCGSRYMKGGFVEAEPCIKNILSEVAGRSLYRLTDIKTHDATNSFKMYRMEALRRICIEKSSGFEINLEIITKAMIQGLKICEVPAGWYDRAEGLSKFRFYRWLPQYLRWYVICLILSF